MPITARDIACYITMRFERTAYEVCYKFDCDCTRIHVLQMSARCLYIADTIRERNRIWFGQQCNLSNCCNTQCDYVHLTDPILCVFKKQICRFGRKCRWGITCKFYHSGQSEYGVSIKCPNGILCTSRKCIYEHFDCSTSGTKKYDYVRFDVGTHTYYVICEVDTTPKRHIARKRKQEATKEQKQEVIVKQKQEVIVEQKQGTTPEEYFNRLSEDAEPESYENLVVKYSFIKWLCDVPNVCHAFDKATEAHQALMTATPDTDMQCQDKLLETIRQLGRTITNSSRKKQKLDE